MDTLRPTKKQRALLDFIAKFIADNGYSPSYREIMNGCGYNSIATVAVHINNLITRGHLRKRDHSARSLELTGTASQERADGASPGVQASQAAAGETWLATRVEQLFAEAEAQAEVAGAVPAEKLSDLRSLLAALRVLGMESALRERDLAPRLHGMEAAANKN